MRSGLDWKWIGIGAAVMFGLSLVAGLIAAALVGDQLAGTAGTGTPNEAAVAGIGTGRLILLAVISFGSFLIGGFIVGLKSPGRTIWEPGISAAIAVALGLLLGGAFSLGNLLAGGVVPFLAGLLGGWLGERRQSSTGGGTGVTTY